MPAHPRGFPMSNRDKREQSQPRSARARELAPPAKAKPPPAVLGVCAYCGERPAVNKEHVVARGFFGKPYPGNLIVVPACRPCNAGTGDGGERPLSEDEE